MDKSSGENSYISFVKANLLPILLGVGGLIFFGYGLMSLWQPQHKQEDIVFESTRDTSSKPEKASSKTKIMVDIEGAVLKPGIYSLEADSRIHDALIMAGGMSPEADRERATKTINLAAKLVDGGKIYIPFMGDPGSITDQAASTSLGSAGGMNVNSATQKELESLPGIGEVTAQKIIAGRPYSTIEELAEKKVVGKKVFEQIKDKVTTY